MSSMFTVPTFTSFGESGDCFPVVRWRARSNFNCSHYYRGVTGQSAGGGDSETGDVLYCSYSVS